MKERNHTIKILSYLTDEVPEQYRSLIQEATRAAKKAYAPYSALCVGAAIRLDNNKIITANNQENAAFPSGMCAERVALYYTNANYPEAAIVALGIIAMKEGKITDSPVYPCGACRQALLESEIRSGQQITIVMAGATRVEVVSSVSDLLPLHFTASFLK